MAEKKTKAEIWADFQESHDKMGVSRGRAQVLQILENKHGIDNPVEDLDIGRGQILGNVTFDGSAISNPPVVIILQNQDGVLALQKEVTLTPGRVLFADSDGLIVQDADLAFDGTILTAAQLRASNLTATRVVFAGAAGLLTDDADLTFDGTALSSAQFKGGNLTSGRVLYAGASGLIQDDADLTFDGTSLTAAQMKASNLTPGRVVFAGTSGLLTDDADLAFDGNTLTTKQLRIAGGTIAIGMISATANLNFPNTISQASSDLTIALTGAAVGDVVMLAIPAAPDADSCFTAWVSATDVVTVRFNNYSLLPINPSAGDFRVAVIQF